MELTYGSLFSGIGGFDLGFDEAGLKGMWQVERDRDCSRVLRKHWPNEQRGNLVEEVTRERYGRVDVICGGFPCQDLSVAGRREGLVGERSGLWREFARIIGEFTPRWCVIENVPGLFSSNRGRDLLTIIRGLEEFGYCVGWTVLDSQYRGVAQRRERVFIVGSLGNGSCAEILFEPESVRGDLAPSREAGKDVAGDVASCLNSGGHEGGFRSEPGQHLVPSVVTHALKSEGADGSEDGTGRGVPIVPQVAWALQERDAKGSDSDTKDGHLIPVAFQPRIGRNGRGQPEPISPALSGSDAGATSDMRPCVATGMSVRRLTPRECERLQGFPDDWTRWDADGKEISDSARYRMLGNAVTVPVAKWIGHRLIANSLRSTRECV